jgi:hypothetical protein
LVRKSKRGIDAIHLVDREICLSTLLYLCRAFLTHGRSVPESLAPEVIDDNQSNRRSQSCIGSYHCAREVAARIVWWAWVATVAAAAVAAPFGDYMTPKDASILLVPGRITVHSEVMSVFIASLPEWGVLCLS